MAPSARIVFLFLASFGLIACGSSEGSRQPQPIVDPVETVSLEAPVHDSTLLNKEILLAWKGTENKNETQWRVTIYTTHGGTKQTVMTLTTGALSCRPLQLADNRSYTWKVEALDKEKETVAVSDEWAFQTYPTRMLPFAGALDQGSGPDEFTHFEGAVYFTAYSPEHGRELWRKRGDANAERMTDIYLDDPSSAPEELTVCGDRLYFSANDGTKGRALWVILPDEEPGMAGSSVSPPVGEGEENVVLPGRDPLMLTVAEGVLYFSGNGSEEGEKTLWRRGDDVSQPEEVVQDGSEDPLLFPGVGCEYGGRLFLSAESQGTDRELWRVDGLTASILTPADGLGLSDPKGFTSYLGKLFFRAARKGAGAELWVVDEEGTPSLIKEIAAGKAPSDPGELTVSDGLLFFVAYTLEHGRELWKSDGTSGGTQRVKDIIVGEKGSQPRNLVASGGWLYFSAATEAEGRELWKSDGSEAGTVLVRDLWPGAKGSSIQEMVSFDDGVMFRAEDDEAGKELWFSGGEANTTFRVKDIRAGEKSGYPDGLVTVGDTLWFRADEGVGGVELWQSDGTEESTSQTDNINTYTDPKVNGVIKVGDHVVMVATSGEYGRELFTLDSEGQLTVLVDIYPGYEGSDPDNLFVYRDQLYFVAQGEEKGRELWVSNGTGDGTLFLADVNPDGDSDPFQFTAFQSEVFFLARVSSQWQLWKTGGDDGTVVVKDGENNPVVVGVAVEGDGAPGQVLAAGETRLFFRKGDALWGMDTQGALSHITGGLKPLALFPVAASLLFAAEKEGADSATLHLLLSGENQSVELFDETHRRLIDPQGFHRTGEMIYFSAKGEGDIQHALFCYALADGLVRLCKDTGDNELLDPDEFCGEEGNFWFMASSKDGVRDIWQISDGAVTAGRLSSVVSTESSETPKSLRSIGDALYFILAYPSTEEGRLYLSHGSSVEPVLDFTGNPLLKAKNPFVLDGFLFITALNSDVQGSSSVQGFWVTSP
ncbi:ELWxxDGT repeat protein [Desulfoluna sp.]|uniref:ELWxxDGT repeat protein n=1 Tax=Desulfoluna sp. TaxID=2045199 RepID=UPI0026183C48|nr:ELWxxDGT repeat protein [Desulfoluna sp.]